MPLYIAPICTDKWVGKSMGCHCRSKITTNTDTCACMHILNQWELHNVHPKQKTVLKTSMLSLKPKSILHNSVVGLACIMYQSSSTLSLKVYIYRRPVWGFPWGENEPNKRDTLKELKTKGVAKQRSLDRATLHVSVPSKPGLLCPQPSCCHYAQVIWPI
jgi:hypothetical protein